MQRARRDSRERFGDWIRRDEGLCAARQKHGNGRGPHTKGTNTNDTSHHSAI